MKIGLIYYAPCNLTQIVQNSNDAAACATCFVAIQLAKFGHEVTIFSQSPNNEQYNVRCRQIEIKDRALRLDPALLETDFNVLIFINSQIEFVAAIKNALPYTPKTFLWTTFAAKTPQNARLDDPTLLTSIDRIICVSNWQRANLYEAYDLPREKLAVVPYAIDPAFEDLFIDGKDFIKSKSPAPCIAYLGDANDGLDIILDSFDDITTNYRDVVLGIFSPVTDQQLLQKLSSNPHIKLHNVTNKAQLAARLRDYTIFINPSVREFIYNINCIETMAAGLYTITADIAANAEYCFGYGLKVTERNLRANSLDNFLSAILSVCQSQVHYSSEFYDVCYKQVLDMNKKHTWASRASSWLTLISES